MLGIIAGDVIGSPYEGSRKSKKDFPLFGEDNRFTDDTVLSVATAATILNGGDYLEYYQEYYNQYPNCGYGGSFKEMAKVNNLRPYGSYGNGSAMRVGPIGWAFDTIEETLKEAQLSSECTHDHHEGIKGAQAVAMAMFYARKAHSKDFIINEVARLGYDLKELKEFEVDKFDVSCQGTIPLCMAVFNETDSFEEAIRVAISMGGDADTNAAIVGGIAEAYYGEIPIDIQKGIFERMPEDISDIVMAFIKEFIDVEYEKPDVVVGKAILKYESLGALFDFGKSGLTSESLGSLFE